MKLSLTPLITALVPLLALPVLAQRPEGEGGGFPGGGRGGMRFVPPLMVALDADKDGTLSAEEISNAATALKTLDKNSDGKLSPEELRPPGREGEGRAGGPGGNPEEMVTRLMGMDKNKDGKLTKDELPERMAGMVDRGDTDKDGALSKDEITKLASAAGGGGERRERREGEGRGERGGEGRPPREGGAPPPPPAPPAPPAESK